MTSRLKSFYIGIGRSAHSIISPFLRAYFKRNTRVRVVILDEQNNILLVRSWFSHQQWSLPGGGIGVGEDATRAAVREVYEETGIHLATNQLESLGEFRNTYPSEPFLIKCLHARIAHKPIRTPKLRKIEIIDAQWFPLAQLPANSSPTVAMAIKLKGVR